MYLYSSYLKSIVFFEKILNTCQYFKTENKPNFSILLIKYILLTHIVCVCVFFKSI